MYLFLDNSAEDNLFFIVVNRDKKNKKFLFKKKKARQGPLFCFDEMIKTKKINLKDIQGVGVLIGSGRFTATRIGVTFGNTLSYFLHCPIVGLEIFDIDEFLSKIKKNKTGIYLSAKYSADANIGQSKKCL